VAVELIGAGIYTAWVLVTIYVCALGVAFMLRYRQGKWKRMRVIEAFPHDSATLQVPPLREDRRLRL